jgi:hypothetical protein
MIRIRTQLLRDEKTRTRFVDLNRDELVRTRLRVSYTGMKYLWLPRSEGCMGTIFLRFTKVFKSPVWALSYVGSEARHARECI